MPDFLVSHSFKQICATLATVIMIYSYVIYVQGMFKGKTKPHAFSWFVWALLTAIAFAAQLVDHGGPGAWVTGATTLGSFLIFCFAITRSDKDITKSDWIAFISALVAIAIWQLTKQPVWSVVLVSLIDAAAFYPTFRKSWSKPDQEVATTYTISGIKFVLAILALQTFTVTTWLYPASLVLMNLAFVIMLLIRRKALSTKVTSYA